MQPALLLVLVLPPPAAGALGFSRPNCAGAGGAADRGEAACVQHIVRDRLARDEIRDPHRAPVKQRADLEKIARRVEFRKADVGALVRLCRSQPGDPGGGADERASERLDLANAATAPARRY